MSSPRSGSLSIIRKLLRCQMQNMPCYTDYLLVGHCVAILIVSARLHSCIMAKCVLFYAALWSRPPLSVSLHQCSPFNSRASVCAEGEEDKKRDLQVAEMFSQFSLLPVLGL